MMVSSLLRSRMTLLMSDRMQEGSSKSEEKGESQRDWLKYRRNPYISSFRETIKRLHF